MKECKKCQTPKKLTEYYTSKTALDGYFSTCKECIKERSRKRYEIMSKDAVWVEQEKERQRKKYYRLEYKGLYYPCREKKKEIIDRFYAKFPEKLKARNKVARMEKKNKDFQFHHWSYNEQHYKDVFELSVSDHNLVHRFLKYDNKKFMYTDLEGNLLDTRIKHEEYINLIIEKN